MSSTPEPPPEAASPEASGWTRQGLARAAGIAAVALGTGAGLGYLVAHEPVPEGPRPSASAAPKLDEAERALLSPLREGGSLGGFDVAEVHPIGDDGVLRIVCRKEHATVRLEIALAAPGEPAPPAVVGPYAVFYAIQNATPAEGERLAKALAAVLQANAGVAVPGRLRPFGTGRR